MNRRADGGMLTEQYLQKIAKQLGHEWHTLGLCLGLSIRELDQLQTDNRNSVVGCTRNMLVQWRNSTSVETSVPVLVAALVEAGRKDLSELVEADYIPDGDMDETDHAYVVQDQLTDQFLSLAIGRPVMSGGWKEEHKVNSRTVTEQLLRKIRKKIGAEWCQLAIELGLSQQEVEQLKEKYHDPCERNIHMLMRWRGDPIIKASIEELQTALIAVGRKDVAEFAKAQDDSSLTENVTTPGTAQSAFGGATHGKIRQTEDFYDEPESGIDSMTHSSTPESGNSTEEETPIRANVSAFVAANQKGADHMMTHSPDDITFWSRSKETSDTKSGDDCDDLVAGYQSDNDFYFPITPCGI